MYDDFGNILVAFPGWTPRTLRAFTVRERAYWEQWARARVERLLSNG